MKRDEIEIEEYDQELYNKISHVYSKKDTIPYSRDARKIRLFRSIRFAKLPIPILLELGCGAGFTSSYLNGSYDKYIGVDYSSKLIEIAKEQNKGEGRRFIAVNIKNLKLEQNQKCDLALMIGVLHHMTERVESLELIKTFMNKSALLIMNEPLDSNLLIRSLRSLRVRFDNTYSEDQVFFSLDGYKQNLEDAGYSYEMYPQGLFTTPLAETAFLPNFIGKPLFLILKPIELLLENLLPTKFLLHFCWNVVIVAKPK
ncbi:class I SAM-dependent methyltransferase [Candidatus Nomurabacteria bacterium]|nr:class I SAM-dependent methyltransferase [Candidatus Nomurabacteria bacterium]